MSADHIQNICALGTGTMGASTALCFALAGYEVAFWGRTDQSLQRGKDNILSALKALNDNQIIRSEDIPVVLGRIKQTTVLEHAARDADFVVESIKEDLGLKRTHFGALDTICRSHTIFATNTSSCSPTDIAEGLSEQRQEQFVVTHFFNPAHLMSLVEVVAGEKTSGQTMTTAFNLMEYIGRSPIKLWKEFPGFVANFLQSNLLHAADDLIGQGYAVAAVDRAAQDIMKRSSLFNVNADEQQQSFLHTYLHDKISGAASKLVQQDVSPDTVDHVFSLVLGLRSRFAGMLEVADLGGLDVFKAIRDNLSDGHNTGLPSSLEILVAQGNFGAKTGQGFYSWSEPRRLERVRDRNVVLFGALKEMLSGKFGQPAFPPMRGFDKPFVNLAA
jgi:3-hydroxybutyryl-CoA dehydrogenase